MNKFCHGCAASIHVTATTCPRCGAKQPGKVGDRDKTTAGLLAIFLGGWGVHKFYLRKPGWGIVYLLLVWTLIPALLGIIEGIRYLCMNQNTFDSKYNVE